MKAGESDEEGREEEAHVGPEGVIDDPPGEGQHGLLQPLAEVLAVLGEGPVGLEHHEAAVHVLQEVELALQDAVGAVREIEAGVEGVAELVLDDGGAGVDEPGVGYHPELLHFAAEEHAGRRQQQRVHRVEAVHGVEPLEEHGGARDDLLPQLELLAQDLDEAAVEDHDLGVLLLAEDGEVGGPLPGQVRPVQHPLGAVRALPEVAGHGVTYLTVFADH